MKPVLILCRTAAAFTLLELAVVLATVALLAAVLLPVLAGTRNDTKTFQCQQNLRQLANAWAMYADDNSEWLVNLNTYADNFGSTLATNVPWRAQINLVSRGFLPYGIYHNTPQEQRYLVEMGYKQPRNNIDGPLFKYAPNVDVVHCPADFRANLPFGTNYTGPFCWDSYIGGGYLNGEWGGFLKRSQISQPSARWTWAESSSARGEDTGSFYLNYYPNAPSRTAFGDQPAAFHNGAANFNFCDGHVDIHVWQNRLTVDFANNMTINSQKDNGGPQPTDNPYGNVDAIWVGSHMANPSSP